MAPIRPYKIDISDERLEKLRRKLELADFPAEPEAGTEYGASVYVSFFSNPASTFLLSYLFPEIATNSSRWKRADEFSSPKVKELAEYWLHDFDWKQQQARLNELPQFKTLLEVDGFGEVDLHFVHQESNVKGAIPLLFVHGCEFCLRYGRGDGVRDEGTGVRRRDRGLQGKMVLMKEN